MSLLGPVATRPPGDESCGPHVRFFFGHENRIYTEITSRQVAAMLLNGRWLHYVRFFLGIIFGAQQHSTPLTYQPNRGRLT